MSADDKTSAEDRLIARYFAPLATDPGALGLSDDAAFVKPPPGCDLVMTVDAIVGGVHFFNDDPAQTIAAKAMRVNLSDLAAKGAKPLGFLVSLALPKEIDDNWLAGFARGLREDAAQFKCPLYGGDTVHTPGPLMVSVSMLGAVPEGKMVRRFGARPGDKVFVTGSIGDAALGLQLRNGIGANWNLTELEHEFLALRYLLPQPRNALAEAVRYNASAAMDVSDGLAGDLAKLCRVSGVAAEIEAARVPLSDAAKAVLLADPGAFETALTGGDDYEILCTVPEAKVGRFRVEAMAAKVAVTEIGVIRPDAGEGKGEGASFRDVKGALLSFKQGSFSHF
jgi:thiamine-monophosphate kinase